MAFYTAGLQDGIKELLPGIVDVSEDFLVAEDGLDYFRWEYKVTQNNTKLVQVI